VPPIVIEVFVRPGVARRPLDVLVAPSAAEAVTAVARAAARPTNSDLFIPFLS
jgi:hypothetical protein